MSNDIDIIRETYVYFGHPCPRIYKNLKDNPRLRNELSAKGKLINLTHQSQLKNVSNLPPEYWEYDEEKNEIVPAHPDQRKKNVEEKNKVSQERAEKFKRPLAFEDDLKRVEGSLGTTKESIKQSKIEVNAKIQAVDDKITLVKERLYLSFLAIGGIFAYMEGAEVQALAQSFLEYIKVFLE